MLYIEYNFHRWLADVGPTLARRSKSRWPNVGSQRRTDGCADVGPTSVRRWNAIWVDVDLKFTKSVSYVPCGRKRCFTPRTGPVEHHKGTLIFTTSLSQNLYGEVGEIPVKENIKSFVKGWLSCNTHEEQISLVNKGQSSGGSSLFLL